MTDWTLKDFVRESNRIEGILRMPWTLEVDAHRQFLEQTRIGICDLGGFVDQIEPGARLRDKIGLNVRVANHTPPPGGPEIVAELEKLLERITAGLDPYSAHHEYENLHPFTDGNGRSGRVLWLWQIGGIKQAPLGFLHHWYYKSLSSGR